MYIKGDGDNFYISRVYWLNCEDCTIYEFMNKDGDIIEIEVKVNESIDSKVKLYFD